MSSPLLLLLVAALLPSAAYVVAMALHAVSVVAAAAAMHAAARSGDERLRRSRQWFARALVASAAGFVVAAVHATLAEQVPVLSPANLAPLVWVPCALAGLFAIPSEEHHEGGRIRAVLDGVVVTAAVGITAWHLFLGPLFATSDRTGLAKAVVIGYPVVELVLAVAALAVAANARADMRRFLRLVTAGLLLVAVADIGNAAGISSGVGGFGWTNVVLQAGLGTLLCAALLNTGADAGDQRGRVAGVVDVVLPHLPVVVATGTSVVRHAGGQPLDGVVVALGSVLVLALAARQVLHSLHLAAVADRLSREATVDALTGLANRRSYLAALETSLAELAPGEVAVVLLDLDGFKEVNDSFGHAAGDVALTGFARRLSLAAGDRCLVARLGGDEFALLVLGRRAEERASEEAEWLTRWQRSSVRVATVSVGASAGVAVNRAGDDTSAILRRADLALYDAKRTGRSCAAVFEDAMAARAERRHLLVQSLPTAASRGELVLEYQPVYRLDDASLVGAEALLRWHSPLHGLVQPAEFVPLAEETGVIAELGGWVLSTAAAQLAAWDADLQLSVNVSPHQLVDGFAEDAVRRLAEHGVAPGAVTLEITESAVPDLAADACLRELRAAGFPIAMDDFGAGFSSLAQLAVLPVDTLKFDRAFIQGIGTDNGRRIVASVIALAADLGLMTVAEGVETAAEADVVLAAGCVLAQGYHFGRPLSAGDLTALLAAAAVPAPREPVVRPDVAAR